MNFKKEKQLENLHPSFVQSFLITFNQNFDDFMQEFPMKFRM
ncbi:hypothetical protein JOC86_000045 [Bacillus pakistanensis]|uniref:Uncharacterized protein n=1 Tax=Rossellomorea pakistanensis TaxID=992288 RepID=A0ABS2N6M9_9BACI|nr:hypothetical protein [Bacillus pakistanensis]MBM7583508.1 hypothetical protein [Bacillus pakistanensis]